MVGRKWTTVAQEAFLYSQLPEYMSAASKGTIKAKKFLVGLNGEFLERLPVVQAPGVSLEDWGLQMLARLKTWMRYRASNRGQGAGTRREKGSLFKALKAPKGTRKLRPVEVYQKMYGEKVGAETSRRAEAAQVEGYGVSSEGAAAEGIAKQVAEGEAESEVTAKRRVLMSSMRWSAMDLYAQEPEDVKRAVEDRMTEINAETRGGINQLGGVASEVLKTMGEHTGWHFMLLAGGPMPNRGGAISIKSICYGTTAHGCDFQTSHATFTEGVKVPFSQYLKRAFGHEQRSARALKQEEDPFTSDGVEGLIPMEAVDGDHVPEEMNSGATVVSREKEGEDLARTKVAAGPPPRSSQAVASAVQESHATGGETAGISAPRDGSDFGSVASTLDLCSRSAWGEDDGTAFDGSLAFEDGGLSDPFGVSAFPGDDSFNVPALIDGPSSSLGASSFDAGSFGGFGPCDVTLGLDGLDESDVAALGPPASHTSPQFDARGEDIVRPQPRALHRGSAYAPSRDVGGSPGRSPTFEKSVLFMAFGKNRSAAGSSSLTHAGTTQDSRLRTGKATTGNIFGFPTLIPTPPVPRTGHGAPTAAAASLQKILDDMGSTTTPPPAQVPTPPPASTPPMPLRTAPPPLQGPTPPPAVRPAPPPASTRPVPPRTALPPTQVPTPPPPVRPAPPPASTPPVPPHTALPPIQVPTPPPPVRPAPPPASTPPVPPRTAPPPTQVPIPPPAAFIETRPAVNLLKAGKGGARGRGSGARGRGGAAGRGRGRPQKNAAPASIEEAEDVQPEAQSIDPPPSAPSTVPGVVLTGEAARAESARIHAAEKQLRANQIEGLRRSKAMEAKAATEAAEQERLAALRHNPAGGADLVLVTRPKRTHKGTFNPDGTPVLKQVKGRRGEVGASRVTRGEDPNVLQEKQDAELLEKLGKGKRKAAGAPAGMQERTTKRKKGGK
ncbi:hypothetical protein MSAN_01105700 [Mycena sanguinolenta]|uniref:Uncharacterized protein n=1 Tax=Mycena sanguinolenta TaxID=230812 RepID=A0A8H6YUA2_9AGAR|nr:hypothetical protein MSAN_01105700 [Mycena sanguinolenta]